MPTPEDVQGATEIRRLAIEEIYQTRLVFLQTCWFLAGPDPRTLNNWKKDEANI